MKPTRSHRDHLCHSRLVGMPGDKLWWWRNPGGLEDDSCYQHLQYKAFRTFKVWSGQPACLALSRSVVLDTAGLGLGLPGIGTPEGKAVTVGRSCPVLPAEA